MADSLELEHLRVRISAEAGEYTRTIRQVISETRAAAANLSKNVTSALHGQKVWLKETQRISAAVKKATEEEIKLAQKRDALIAKNYLKTHLKAIDDTAKHLRRVSDEDIRNAQRRDAIIARNHVREALRAQDMAAAQLRRNRDEDIRNAQRRDAIIARNHVREHLRAIDQVQRAQNRAFEANRRRANAPRGPQLTSAGQILRGAGSGISRAGMAMSAGVTAPATALGAASVGAFASFDDAITRAEAVAGGLSDRMRARMVENAKQIASSGIISARDLAGGYYHLIAAGLTAEQALQALGISQRFATASTMDLEHAVEMLVQSQTVLGLRSADAAKNAANMKRVSDSITRAANMSTASIEHFARAITTKSGAAARVLGKDMTELVAVLTALANQGTKAELAGEQVYMVWRDLQMAAIKNAAAWKKLGVSVYDTNGRMLNTADIVAGLEKLLVGMSDEQRKVTMKILGFTDRSVAATYTLLGLSGAIRDAQRQLQSLGDETNSVAKRMESSFLSQLKKLWNQLTIVAIEIGEVLSPYIRMLGEYVRQGVMYWRQLSPSVKQASVALALVAATAGPLLLFMGGFITSIAAVVAGLGILIAAGPGVVAAAGGIGAAAIAASGYFALLAKNVAAAFMKLHDPKGYETIVREIDRMTRVASELLTAFGEWFIATLTPILTKAARKTGEEFGKAIVDGIKYAFTTDWVAYYERELATAEATRSHLMKSGWSADEIAAADIKIERIRDKLAKVRSQRGASSAEATPPNFFSTASGIIAKEYGRVRPQLPPQSFRGVVPAGTRGIPTLGAAKADLLHEFSAEFKDAVKEEEKAEKHVESLTARIKEQIATHGMNSRQITIWRLEQAKASAEVIKAAKAEDIRLTALENSQKAAKKAADDDEKRKHEAARILEKHMSLAVRLQKEKADLDTLLSKKLIDKKTYDAELKDLEARLNKEHTVRLRFDFLDPVVAGTAQAEAMMQQHTENLMRKRDTAAAERESRRAAGAAAEAVRRRGRVITGRPHTFKAPPVVGAARDAIRREEMRAEEEKFWTPWVPASNRAAETRDSVASTPTVTDDGGVDVYEELIEALKDNTEATKKSESLILQPAGLA